MTKYILTIDGGGIKGIIPCYVLLEIEKQINTPLSQVFDLMSGSSVGAIIIAALNLCNSEKKPIYNSEDILKFLLKYGPIIFKKSLCREIISLFSGSRYSSKVLEKILSKLFKDTLFGRLIKHVLVPSYNLSSREPHMFKSWDVNSKKIKVTDILMATTAAPTYFSPKKIKIKKKYSFIDGGIVANNPVVCAYAAAKKLFPNEDLCFLSIGCGKNKQIDSNQNYNCYGAINWLRNIIHIIFDASIEAVDYQMKRIVGHDRYFRISTTLDHASFAMDNASPRNISYLHLDARKTTEKHKKNIEKFCQLVINDQDLVEKK